MTSVIMARCSCKVITSRKTEPCSDKGREMDPTTNPFCPKYLTASIPLWCSATYCVLLTPCHMHMNAAVLEVEMMVQRNVFKCWQNLPTILSEILRWKKGQNKASWRGSDNASKHPDCDKLTRKSQLRMNLSQRIVWERAKKTAVRHNDSKLWKDSEV